MKVKSHILFILAFLILTGCSLKRMAMNAMADALSEGSSNVYASDEDPRFVGEALPFALKTMESVLQSTPEHTRLLTATAASFVQYGYAFVLMPAESLERSDYRRSKKERYRAKRFFLRARNYGLRALNSKYTGIGIQLNDNPIQALSQTKKVDIPALYWTAAAWASAISSDKSDMALVADLPIVEALMERCMKLDETWGNGAIHEFFLVYDAGRSIAAGGGIESAERHFKRAMQLNHGKSISPLVSLAESTCIPEQNRTRFENILTSVLKMDVNKFPENRMANILMQQKAKRLLADIDFYFIN